MPSSLFRRILAFAPITACAVASAALTPPLRALETLAQDRGAAGTWQKLLKLKTIGSVLHTTAHPDDEHGGLLAMLSRGEGARVTLLTLNRGEAGDNAIGSELFDPLGLIRTEELLRADQYYGVDQQYFTSVIDYGFSKRLEEALVKWGRENVLRDVVRVIRTERPLVLIARFQGNDRDGHGNHQASGVMTQEAFRVAGDPSAFPEQIAAGLRPWQPLKVYIGGMRENEDWTVRVNPAVYSPWLGDSYANFARTGLSYQRSQNSGRNDPQPSPAYGYYRRVGSHVTAPAKESSVFDGIDTHLTGLFATLKHPAPASASTLLGAIEREVDAAVSAFRMENPSATVPALARGLRATRVAIDSFKADADAVHILRIKEQQFQDAITTALAIDLSAVAQPAGLPEPTGPGAAFAAPSTMDPVVRGQSFDVKVRFTNRGATEVVMESLRRDGAGFAGVGGVVLGGVGGGTGTPLTADQSFTHTFTNVTVKPNAPFSQPYFSRSSIAESRYTIRDATAQSLPASAPAFAVMARYRVEGEPIDLRVPVVRREPNLPYGYAVRELAVVPALAVNVSPRQAVVPQSQSTRSVRVQVELINNAARTAGQLTLRVPAGWKVEPASAAFTFARAGEKSRHEFVVAVPAVGSADYTITAVATANGQDFSDGYDIVEHRDLETRYLYHEAAIHVRGIDVKIAPGLKVGYVMGVGDSVPDGIAQLGAQVRLLTADDLAAADLGAFDAIMTGTRAYAVRDDLRTYNTRLLDYAKNGGNLIVLYNTPAEFDPNAFAPYPAELPRNAEEVSEEDSPVTILAPARPEFTTPNAITVADFNGWVEQRGSKFFSEWDKAYTAMIATHDQGQPPQRGGWLTASYGKGHYTYFAYAFHRQLPYGVPGAYRLLANLLSLGKSRSTAP